ncbi:MobV family relaxase [Pseudomonas sp. 2FE]|uniref:MobV family relaxase n=1 Tax=Pseudomonas sp. 2FE TaxID=2502190 RepID=UPI0010F5E340|nr:MobV family relaxase [Pseudomonas sp. 2FE]
MYSIIRANKHKSLAAISRSARHTFREQPTPNADPAQQSQNRVVGAASCQQLIRALNDRLPVRRRRDAVLCIEYLITASPEAFQRYGGPLDDLGNGYFRDALAWLRHRHGNDQVLCAAVHLDESTPHMVAYVVPLTQDGRLSARDYLGGPKVVSAMQDSFYAACGAPRGLSRGVKGAKAKHSDIASFYRTLADAGAAPRLSAIDYAAKALGHQTPAWQHAETISKAHAQGIAVELKRKKAREARAKKLERNALELKSAATLLRQQQVALAQRERSLSRGEKMLARRLPELEIIQAKAEMLERLLNQERALTERPVRRPRNRSLDNLELAPDLVGG